MILEHEVAEDLDSSLGVADPEVEPDNDDA